MTADGTSPALRLIGLIEHVSRADKAQTLTEIIGALKQPKPTVYRMLQQLEQAGLLIKEPDGKRYAPGPRLSRLAEDVLLNGEVRAARHAILQRLVEETGETCNFTMQSGTEVVYLDRVETAWPLRFHLQPGSRVPIHCSASGKLFLAYMPAAQRTRLLGLLQFRGYTANTITTKRRLEAELADVRAHGYALDNEEYLDGLVCIAVPIFDPTQSHRIRGSVAIQAPSSRFSIANATSALPALQRAASAFAESIAVSQTPRAMSRRRATSTSAAAGAASATSSPPRKVPQGRATGRAPRGAQRSPSPRSR